MNMSGRKALVTGAANGIGVEIASLFAQQGAYVYLLDKDERALYRVVDGLNGSGTVASGHVVDLCDANQVAETIGRIHDEVESVDVLVNNAGADPRRPFLEMDEQEWKRVLDINLNSAYRCTRLVSPPMVKCRAGKIINISSVTFHWGLRNLSHYIAAKGALVGFTRALARELGEHNVHVNCITPGAILTEREATVATPEQAAAVIQMQSLQRRILPIDVARVCVFLATQWSDGLTGQTINVDGGWVMY